MITRQSKEANVVYLKNVVLKIQSRQSGQSNGRELPSEEFISSFVKVSQYFTIGFGTLIGSLEK